GDYILWHGRREQHRAAWRAFFREWDVLLAPAINVLAYPHIPRAWPADDSDLTLTLTVNGKAVPYLHLLCYPAVSTVPGQPFTATHTRVTGRGRRTPPPGSLWASRAGGSRSGCRLSGRPSRTSRRSASRRAWPARSAASASRLATTASNRDPMPTIDGVCEPR